MATLIEIPKTYDSNLSLYAILGMDLGLLLVFVPLLIVTSLP